MRFSVATGQECIGSRNRRKDPAALPSAQGVEQFGIEPVPPELKTVRWHDIFAIIFGFALNPGSMLVGGMAVVSGLSFWGAIGAITSGILLATIAYTITATVGVDYGLPGQVSMRMVYGLRGAKCF